MREPDDLLSDLDPRLLEGLESDRWRVLYRVSGLLSARAADLPQTLSTILSVVLAATRGERALLLRKNEDGQLEVEAIRGSFPGDPREHRISWTIVQRVFQTEQGVYVPEISDDSELAHAKSIESLSLRSALCVPLKTGVFEGEKIDRERRRLPPFLGLWREVIGVIYVDSTRPRKPYDQDDLGLLQALANIAATAITNARLHADATRDPATGLLTRRYFEILLGKVHLLSRRHRFPYGILLLSVEPEHPGGPEAAARGLAGALRSSDLPARYGARSFAAVLPYAGAEDVRIVAAKVALAVPGIRIGASAVPDPAPDASRAVEQADRALATTCVPGGPTAVFWSAEVGNLGPRADRLAGLVSASESEDHRRLEELVDEHARLKERGTARATILGDSPVLVAALERARKVAPTQATVLLAGESGTGKELFARAIHEMGSRPDGPFVVVDCGAIPENLLESELFGHEAGAFTGATGRHIGKFERATGGTLFLDEVGELPLVLQVKFLRVLQERRIERVGGKEAIPIDVRVVAATNRDLEAAVREGKFRQDLYYRLDVVPIRLPALRERGRDILVLARSFLDRFAREFAKPLSGFDDEATQALLAYGWPGNVRELENRIQQASILAEDTRITAADLALPGFEAPRKESFQEARQRAIEEFERDYITGLLAGQGGDVAACAREMGLSERRFRELRAKYGIRREEFEE
ncbi:MAG: sigma 54-interacting transcriptional regulator [Planctomycetes bacterium]|nr:sigma 54-interacting transcriptional regulator [Planctomycetota bacterium]